MLTIRPVLIFLVLHDNDIYSGTSGWSFDGVSKADVKETSRNDSPRDSQLPTGAVVNESNNE